MYAISPVACASPVFEIAIDVVLPLALSKGIDALNALLGAAD
jgi:hypothetical protein